MQDSMEREAPPGTSTDVAAYPPLTKSDVRHNMIVIVLLDTIFTTGVADLNIVTTPLWVFLGATSSQIGAINSMAFISLLGVVLSPFISVRFKFKKWYLFFVHLPYIGTWGVMGIVTALSGHLSLSNSWLLGFLAIMTGANFLFGGFVGLPHQEYTSACIPMSHRARYSGYSMTFGSIMALGSTFVGGLILAVLTKPMAFGYLYLLTWLFCQTGYLMALLGRERPTPVDHAPAPWSLAMLRSVWQDKKFLRLILLHAAYTILLTPVINIFIGNYAFKELGMAAALSAVIVTITNVTRIGSAAYIGRMTDRLHPVRVLPWWSLVAALAILTPVLIPSQAGIYISTALGCIFALGSGAAFLALIYGLPKPEHRSGHYTIQLIENYAASSIGPLLVGWLCDVLTFRVTFLVFAGFAVLMFPLTKRMLRGLSANLEDYA